MEANFTTNFQAKFGYVPNFKEYDNKKLFIITDDSDSKDGFIFDIDAKLIFEKINYLNKSFTSHLYCLSDNNGSQNGCGIMVNLIAYQADEYLFEEGNEGILIRIFFYQNEIVIATNKSFLTGPKGSNVKRAEKGAISFIDVIKKHLDFKILENSFEIDPEAKIVYSISDEAFHYAQPEKWTPGATLITVNPQNSRISELHKMNFTKYIHYTEANNILLSGGFLVLTEIKTLEKIRIDSVDYEYSSKLRMEISDAKLIFPRLLDEIQNPDFYNFFRKIEGITDRKEVIKRNILKYITKRDYKKVSDSIESFDSNVDELIKVLEGIKRNKTDWNVFNDKNKKDEIHLFFINSRNKSVKASINEMYYGKVHKLMKRVSYFNGKHGISFNY